MAMNCDQRGPGCTSVCREWYPGRCLVHGGRFKTTRSADFVQAEVDHARDHARDQRADLVSSRAKLEAEVRS